MSIETLLLDFEKVESSAFSYVDQEDKRKIEEVEAEWLSVKAHYTLVIADLKELQNKIGKVPTSSIIPERGYRNQERVNKRVEVADENKWKYDLPLGVKHRFNFDFSIAYAINSRLAAFEVFQNLVYSHFRDKYNLESKPDNFTVANDSLERSLEDMVSKIIELNNHVSFKDAGIEKLKEDFRKALGRRVKIQKDKVIFDDVFWFDNWGRGYQISSGSKLDDLALGLSFFENGRTDISNYIARSLPHNRAYLDFKDIYEFDEDLCEKLKSAKFFKNGRLDIRFKSEGLAYKFTQELSLTIVK